MYVKWIIIVFAVLFVISTIWANRRKLFDKEADRWHTKKVVVSKDEYYNGVIDLGIVSKWEEQKISEQFPFFEFKGRNYEVRNATIDEEKIGDKLRRYNFYRT